MREIDCDDMSQSSDENAELADDKEKSDSENDQGSKSLQERRKATH